MPGDRVRSRPNRTGTRKKKKKNRPFPSGTKLGKAAVADLDGEQIPRGGERGNRVNMPAGLSFPTGLFEHGPCKIKPPILALFLMYVTDQSTSRVSGFFLLFFFFLFPFFFLLFCLFLFPLSFFLRFSSRKFSRANGLRQPQQTAFLSFPSWCSSFLLFLLFFSFFLRPSPPPVVCFLFPPSSSIPPGIDHLWPFHRSPPPRRINNNNARVSVIIKHTTPPTPPAMGCFRVFPVLDVILCFCRFPPRTLRR